MRSQGYTIQQALTPDAAAVVKQAVGLAKRRGHAQVTPLHVAHTMLSASSGLLRAACLQSHSHPLQCRALELCFNVALNRLPTSTSGPMLGPHSAQIHHPTIANALVAAFKRAQAHQRRGSIETQQQPLLAVKIELEQLIISILDDPSVSRVMREAGFSSTLVKAKVEQAVSVEPPLSPNNNTPNNNNNTNNSTNNYVKVKDNNNNSSNDYNSSCVDVLSMSQPGLVKMMMGKPRLILSNNNNNDHHHQGGGVRNDEDVVRVIESLVKMNTSRKRNTVIVGESIATLECLVKEVMNRVEKNEVPEVLKEVRCVQLSFSSFGHLSRQEVDQRVVEIKSLVKNCCLDNNTNNSDNNNKKGLLFYMDDLKWANEFRASSNNNNIIIGEDDENHQPMRRSYYCPIEHMIMEIGKLVMNYAENGKLWILGIATFQTYMRCQSGQPSLETLWGLHAITIPTHSLGLSLLSDSELQGPLRNKNTEVMSGSGWLMMDGFRGGGRIDDTRSRQGTPCNSETSNTTLPLWLQQYKDENTKRTSCDIDNHQDSVPTKDLCKRWSNISRVSTSSSPSFERSLSLSSISPSSSTSNFSYDTLKLQHSTHQSFEPTKNFFVNEPRITMSIHERDNNNHHTHQRPTNMFISSNPNSTPTSTSSSDVNEPIDQLQGAPKMFKEYNADNLRALCNALEKRVPRQKDIVFDIASTILQCRTGSCMRKVSNHERGDVKEDTWLFFQGFDVDAKESIAREIARLVFGSNDKFVSIGLSNFSSTRADYSLDEDCSRNKRLRDEHNCVYIERFAEEVSRDHRRVFFVEDIEQVDYCSQMGIKKAIERGKIRNQTSGEEVSFGDSIIILSCEKYSSRSRACSPATKLKIDVLPQEDDDDNMILNMRDGKETTSPRSVSLDLNISITDDDNNVVDSRSMDEIGLLASVDRCITFKNFQDL